VLCPLGVFVFMGPWSFMTTPPGAAWLHDLIFFQMSLGRVLAEWQGMVPVLWAESGWAWFVVCLACLYGAIGMLALWPFLAFFPPPRKEQ
jgi:hypothetical protein